jgi:hypothetical protein
MHRAPWFVIAVILGAAGCDDGDATPDGTTADAPRGDARPVDARPDGLGSVDNVPGSCSNGTLPRTSCRLLRVRCDGIEDRQVEIRITDPPAAVTRIGTLVLGTGGGGTTHIESTPTGRAMLDQLSQAGYRLIQRQWIGDNGWIGGPGGFAEVSCRYASLIAYFYEQVHFQSESEAFCVTGNSGGASEIAYALARWNRAPTIELALMTGGPPMGRIDHGCLDGADPTWLAECASLVPGGSTTCAPPGPACGYAPGAAMLIDSAYGGTSCATADEGQRAGFLADSAAAPGTTLDYPGRTHFLFGADDCTEAVPLGLAYAAAITSPTTIEFVPGTPHQVFGTTEGANAIRDAVIAGCVVP